MASSRWMLLALAAMGCGSSGNGGGADGGMLSPDSTSSGNDSGHGGRPDARTDGKPGIDGTSPTDTGTPGHGDGGAPRETGTSQDTGTPEDTGAPHDAGAPHDSGTSAGDASVVGYVPGGQAGPGTTVSGCQIFPSDNAWNVEVDGPNVKLTTAYTLPQSTHPHPDLGGWSPDGGVYGIPFNVVPSAQADVKTTFGCFADESDPGPSGWTTAPMMGTICPAYGGGEIGVTTYPFFTGMKIEGDLPANSGQVGGLPGDSHGLVLEQASGGGSCTVWEAWNCQNTPAPFTCANGAKWDLGSNALRTLGWTSADLGGLSVFAGLLKIAELKSGTITHAVRVTFNDTQAGYLLPATHAISSGSGASALGGANPPMGLRIRMKASVDTSSWSGPGQTVAAGMKKYGLLVADIGSDWFFQGDSDDTWNATAPDGNDSYVGELITDFKKVTGADFEVVDTGTPANTGL